MARGVVVSGNEVNPRLARLLLGWGSIPYRYVTSQVGQLSLASLRGRLIKYQLCWAKAGMSPLSGGS